MVNRRSGLGFKTGENSNTNPNLTQIMQAFVAALNANRRNPNHDDEPMTRTRAMNEFCKRRPPTFHGDPNPTVAKTWLKEVKCALRLESEEADFKTPQKKATGSTSGPIKTQPPSNHHGPYFTKPSKPPQSNQPWRTVILGSGEPKRGGRDIATVQCYHCQAMGHYKCDCPQLQREKDGSCENQKAQQPGLAGFVKQNLGGPLQQNGQNERKQPMGNQQGTRGRIFAPQTKEQERDPYKT
ncbi:hypothetical protein RHMOL_Rhmol02G0186200 [Rhododendron molle]|uniref:Uncharacterized protein n=1 Tax=Rhododendron molle TaxID=49168 RepID=A0ACC0PS11_RHOML|nr:hypothetical protein RHMOL_Rhmol02G0186200 [Rhododendron molle]